MKKWFLERKPRSPYNIHNIEELVFYHSFNIKKLAIIVSYNEKHKDFSFPVYHILMVKDGHTYPAYSWEIENFESYKEYKESK